MRSKTTERILSETPQETKDKVRETTSREISLLRVGFEKNTQQETFIAFKYDRHWYVDFWEVEELDGYEWSVLMEHLIEGFKSSKKHWFDGLREHPAYSFVAKEFKKKILDTLNKYRADLQQVNNLKLDKTVNQEARIRLEAKVELLIEIQNKLK
jgi:uncharacterized protein YkwD